MTINVIKGDGDTKRVDTYSNVIDYGFNDKRMVYIIATYGGACIIVSANDTRIFEVR
mgnify:CR=1 FL=1